jgi:uroporphyrinogen-III synthase
MATIACHIPVVVANVPEFSSFLQTTDILTEYLETRGIDALTTEVYQTEAQPINEIKRIKVRGTHQCTAEREQCKENDSLL